MPHPFSRRVPAAAVWEGVLTFGVSPITVAGPWPIFTAFPASHTCWMSKAVYGARLAVSTRGTTGLDTPLILRFCQ